MVIPFTAVVAVTFVLIFIVVSTLITIKNLRREISALKSERDALSDDRRKLFDDYALLQNKFKDNPSYECQQLLADLLNGHALFHIERLSPENVLLRRS